MHLSQSCMYQLSTRSAALQKFLYRPFTQPFGPNPNLVISSQSDCPNHFSLQEYRDLCSVPYGIDLQWFSIAAQLYAPSIDLNTTEATSVFLQCIYQVGPPTQNHDGRQTHIILTELDYGNSLLQGLDEALRRIESNWESVRALDLLCAVVRRLLSSSQSEIIRRRCLQYLRRVSCVAMDWTKVLKQKVQDAGREEDRLDHQKRALEMALVCASTFDLDDGPRREILSSSDSAATLLRCSIIIRDLKHALNVTPGRRVAVLHERHLRVLFDEFERLKLDQLALNMAVGETCIFYQHASVWNTVDAATHWVHSSFMPEGSTVASEMHFDLLSGQLLVNGSPLNRLPDSYEQCDIYKILFGTSAIDVVSISSSAMEYSSKEEYQGQKLQFGWCQRDGRPRDLVVQASDAQTKFVLLPADIFQGALPDVFITDYVHWYNATKSTVEFRPRDQPWTSGSRTSWIFSRSVATSTWRLTRPTNQVYAIGAKSDTSCLLAKIFAPLATPLQIHAAYQPRYRSLEISFAGIKLGFLLEQGSSNLKSRDFSGMSVDYDQTLGALIGFRNKLLLTGGFKRIILAIEGMVSFQPNVLSKAIVKTGTAVTVNLSGTRVVHPFAVNTMLRQLTGNGTLSSDLYLAYISALTSFCLPDPLTGKTGTEQALSILRSARVRSFDCLSQMDVDLLHLIARLSLSRAFYPRHERVMETISWQTSLGPLAQHPDFHNAVQAIIAHAQRSQVFYPQNDVRFPYHDTMCLDLLHRDQIRSSSFRVPGFGAEDFTTKHDVLYQGRTCGDPEREERTYTISHTAFHRNGTRRLLPLPPGSLWNLAQKVVSFGGPRKQLQANPIRYDASYVVDGTEFVGQNWLALHKLLFERNDSQPGKFAVIFWLSTLAYSKLSDGILEILVQGYLTGIFDRVNVPECETYQISDGTDARPFVDSKIQCHSLNLAKSPERMLEQLPTENKHQFAARRNTLFQKNREQAKTRLGSLLKEQWQHKQALIPVVTDTPIATYIDVTTVVAQLNVKFENCFANRLLQQYFAAVEKNMIDLPQQKLDLPKRMTCIAEFHPSHQGFVHGDQVFANPAPALNSGKPTLEVVLNEGLLENGTRLGLFIHALCRSEETSSNCRKYIDDLAQSLEALQNRVMPRLATMPNIDSLRAYHSCCAERLRFVETKLHTAVTHMNISHQSFIAAGEAVGHSRRVTPELFLSQLNAKSWSNLDRAWKTCIVEYGLAFTALQRAVRTLSALQSGRTADATREWDQTGHQNWNPINNPESLLLEVESGILIREVQEQIAQQMRTPKDNRNTSMQLNMGEGKSSVIVPMTCLHLADASRLVRVLVAKPQFKQMMQMLISKLGGLLNRRVYYLPLSRSLKPTPAMVSAIDTICRECMTEGGVLLVQPEHLLSFQLMVLERPICGDHAIGQSLLRTHRFLEESSRDIVDESDENFSVKFELIYTVGSQRQVELGSERWACIAEILDIIREVVPRLALDLPDSFQVEKGTPGSFPLIRILKSDGGARLTKEVAEHVCRIGVNGLPIATQTLKVRKAVFAYITEWNLQPETVATVEDEATGFWSEAVRPKLLLLRGLLAGGVLLFAFSRKRWSVNYGLHPSRVPSTRLAVPYKANDQPSLRADFSYPDVVIILTYLTYYYCGLTDEHLFSTFTSLLSYDQRDLEFGEWIKDVDKRRLPMDSLRSINLKDRELCTSVIFPELRTVKSVVDFFLSRIVFPKELRVFPQKLSASGWDIGRIKQNPTTAFSGTCDTSLLLPLSVDFLALPEQQHTNALVLNYLLQPENAVCRLSAKPPGSDAEWIIQTVMKLPCQPRVILDVGAQLLELDNLRMAQAWLTEYPTEYAESPEAVIFFNDQDELCVVDRQDNIEALRASPYLDRLEACLVFLDEAHTRGTDLKLPVNYRAVVTLGPTLTKDRLVQACMRMRKLGQGQTVIFAIPPEIQRKILKLTCKAADAEITISDVLLWTIAETHTDLQQSVHLWAAQGKSYLTREELWSSHADADGLSFDNASRFLEAEAKSLEQRYRPTSAVPSHENEMDEPNAKHSAILARCKLIDPSCTSKPRLEEEQEKELSPEMEEERQVERPTAVDPAKHALHPDVVAFASTGVIEMNSKAFLNAFASLKDMDAAITLFDVRQFPSKGATVLVTEDFARTIEKPRVSYTSDAFLRSPQWILMASGKAVSRLAVVLSPYEAQHLMPTLRATKSTVLSIYKPHWNTQLPRLNRLDFINYPFDRMPPWPSSDIMTQLNLFAGRLNFSTQDEYRDTCQFLSLAYDDQIDSRADLDGYISDGSRFSNSPVPFIKAFTSVRVDHRDLAKTHIANMLAGVRLQIAS